MRTLLAGTAILALAIVMTMTGRGGGNFYVPILVASGERMHEAATTGQFILLATAVSAFVVWTGSWPW